MRILIISKSFAPDNGIASKRTSTITKYLLKLGHDVTVIRSGLIFGIAEKSNLEGLELATIVSYEGSNSIADIFEKTDSENTYVAKKKIKEQNNDYRFFNRIKKVGHVLLDPINEYQNSCKRIRKLICTLYDSNSSIRSFDVVISSFGPLGCIEAAEYIRDKEHAKWIIDFRDLMDNQTFTIITRTINHFKQIGFLKKADACLCVSKGNGKRLAALCGGRYSSKVHVLYNGFDGGYTMDSKRFDAPVNALCNDDKLHICYTGMLYGGKRDCSPLFQAIKQARRDISIQIDYAGRDGEILKSQASLFEMENIIVDHGYLSRTDVNSLQSMSDIFLVISWNTQQDQGIMTGKFYEALQHKKPIIALVGGDLENSELKTIINQYRLGVCYEEAAGKDQLNNLVDYIDRQTYLISKGMSIEYNPDNNVFNMFDYAYITERLNNILMKVCNNEE